MSVAPPPTRMTRPAASSTRVLTQYTSDAPEPNQRPLNFGIIRRLLTYMRPHAKQRNKLIFAVMIRGIQLPLIGWVMAYVINGPIHNRDVPGLVWGILAYLGLALWTCIHFHFRQRWSLELGEAVVHDLRRDIFAHLHTLSMSYFHRTKVGRTISRMTSDTEAVRIGMQDVFFVGILCIFQMTVSALFMLYYDWTMFIAISLTAPTLSSERCRGCRRRRHPACRCAPPRCRWSSG
jgi:ATP-binding cassette subfamily B protein